ncbi:hypothetical protein KNP414_05855 [Paenibacillus mucilaginosus KNP414]|uniref:Uncharacterized protein n=1 Tax=Paenibacillus mucilaginosus (strain KNP414) TaxID=1036673 RepID=F8F9Q0_PAEMK|nr:hypothetical protein KNP414_05855 [Paenibacillus mucilaginosus KNP414]
MYTFKPTLGLFLFLFPPQVPAPPSGQHSPYECRAAPMRK